VDRFVLRVGRWRCGNEKRLKPCVGVGFDSPIVSCCNDDDVTWSDAMALIAITNDPGAVTDMHRDVAFGPVYGDELSGLEVPTDDFHPIALKHPRRGEALCVVSSRSREVGRNHMRLNTPRPVGILPNVFGRGAEAATPYAVCRRAGEATVGGLPPGCVHVTDGNIFGSIPRWARDRQKGMGAIPGSIDTDHQPPMTVPLRHFVVGLGFLLVGTTLTAARHLGVAPGLSRLASVHLFFVGWICLTILGAMTLFVPVWSGVSLHSRRLADVQLGAFTLGLTGVIGSFLTLKTGWLIPFGLCLLAGFWVFAYNIFRTLCVSDGFDVTERHFLIALGFMLMLTVLGVSLAIDLTVPAISTTGLSRLGVVGAHATLAVFGAVLTTVYGALYQLGTMFTQTELHGLDHRLRLLEELSHPIGVVLLAGGRLVANPTVARIGGICVLLAAVAICGILARRLLEMHVDPTPMHTRYAVAVCALTLWAIGTAPAWVADPLSRTHLLGAEYAVPLLSIGAIGFIVIGTLYHVIPFVIWVNRYSDLLGLEDVPMIDDLYDDRIAAVDGVLLATGTALTVIAGASARFTPLASVGAVLVALGVAAFALNVGRVISRHGTHPIDQLVLGGLSPRRARTDTDPSTEAE